jgi:hypothetical protein
LLFKSPEGTEGHMDLREFVHKLTDFIWEREHKSQKPVDAAILSYVQDAVIAELEYRRRMSDLDRRIAELESLTGVGVPS